MRRVKPAYLAAVALVAGLILLAWLYLPLMMAWYRLHAPATERQQQDFQRSLGAGGLVSGYDAEGTEHRIRPRDVQHFTTGPCRRSLSQQTGGLRRGYARYDCLVTVGLAAGHRLHMVQRYSLDTGMRSPGVARGVDLSGRPGRDALAQFPGR